MAKKATKKSTKPKGIAFYSKKYGISADKLRKVYKRGMGAYYSSGSERVLVHNSGQWAVCVALLRAKGVLERQMLIYSRVVRRKNEKRFIC